MESLLSFAADLERRDAAVAAALDDVERLAREIDELRVDGTAVAAFLASLPTARAQNGDDERAARNERSRAKAALAEAEGRVAAARRESDRLAAERAAQQLRDALQAADGRVEAARAAAAALVREADNAARGAEVLAERAAGLHVRVRDVAAPGAGLDGALEWASCARGAVLLERSALAAERELLAREASELLGSVLGEPLLATAVAGVRDRLERALASG